MRHQFNRGIAFRGDCKKCTEILDKLGYEYSNRVRGSLPKDYPSQVLIVTYDSDSEYSILHPLPHPDEIESIFYGRKVSKSFEEFERDLTDYHWNEGDVIPDPIDEWLDYMATKDM